MKTELTKDNQTLIITIEGSIDTVTSLELEKLLQENWDGYTELILDFSAVEYVSSAGLRVLMITAQHMEEINGNLTIKNVDEAVNEVFVMTGFDDMLTII